MITKNGHPPIGLSEGGRPRETADWNALRWLPDLAPTRTTTKRSYEADEEADLERISPTSTREVSWRPRMTKPRRSKSEKERSGVTEVLGTVESAPGLMRDTSER